MAEPVRHGLRCGSSVAALLCLALAAPRLAVSQNIALVREVFVELSIGKSVPLDWSIGEIEYSLAVPRDAPLAAVRVAIMQGESEEEAFSGALALRVPLRGLAFALSPGEPSAYVEVETDVPTVLKLDIAEEEYTINVIRSKIASNGQAEHPDLARSYPPRGTLSGLALADSLGHVAHMAWFTPRVSVYYASVGKDARSVRLVATPNDPDAELEWRADGGKWDFLVSGLTSTPARVSSYGWTLFEVRVRSAAALATGDVTEPLVYQIAVTKDVVCHPKCRACDGPSFDDCTSCYAPLLLYNGKCLYTSCQSSGKYFDPIQEQCLSCHPSCVECEDGTAQTCTVCPPMSYLVTSSAVSVSGQCVAACPFGYYVQPISQRCQRAPASIQLEAFYFRLDLRIAAEDWEEQRDYPQQVLQVAVEVLRVSPQDVRFHKWDAATSGLGVFFYFEVENPFLRKGEAEKQFTIDQWFSALPVPVDSVVIMSQAQLYPPPLTPKPDPLLPPWMWGLIGGGATGLLLLVPLYHFYFVAKYFQTTPYKQKADRNELFVSEVMDKATNTHIDKAAALAERPKS